MANQKFRNSFREALWETHGKKCFHCSRELPFQDMEVDHIVPEHLQYGSSENRIAILASIGLPQTFNILGNENLAPSCWKCNGDKSGANLIGGATAIALTRISSKLPELQINLQKRRNDRELEDILRAVGRAVEQGTFGPEQFRRELEKILNKTEINSYTTDSAFEPGKIYNRAPPIGFTAHAYQRLMRDRILPGDLVALIYKSINQGKVEAHKTADLTERYVLTGVEGLRIVFRDFGSSIVILTVFLDD